MLVHLRIGLPPSCISFPHIPNRKSLLPGRTLPICALTVRIWPGFIDVLHRFVYFRYRWVETLTFGFQASSGSLPSTSHLSFQLAALSSMVTWISPAAVSYTHLTLPTILRV